MESSAQRLEGISQTLDPLKGLGLDYLIVVTKYISKCTKHKESKEHKET